MIRRLQDVSAQIDIKLDRLHEANQPSTNDTPTPARFKESPESN